MAVPYQVQVAIALSSNHGTVLGALARHLGGIHTQVNQLHSGFSRLKLAIGGALAVGAGMGILNTMIKLVDKTKEYSDELVKLERMGGAMGRDVRSGAAANLAFDVGMKANMKVTDVMKIQGQTYSILGEEGKNVIEPLAKFAFLMQSDKNYKGNAGDDLAKFLRAGELGGRLTDPKTHQAAIGEVNKFLDLSAKVMSATHGMVSPNTLLGMTQQAGFSMRGQDEKGFMTQAIMAQAMGGPRAGTALLSLYNQVATGKMTKPAALGMVDIGLLKKNEVTSDHGKVLIADSGKKRLGALLGKSPLDFIETVIANLEKRGIHDPQEQMRRVANAMSRQTSQRFVTEGMMNLQQIKAELGRMGQGLGGGAGADLTMQKSVGANQKALQNAWDNFWMAVVGPNAENTIATLRMLTDTINNFTKYIRTVDPNTLKNIAIGIGALMLALTGAGAATMLAALGPAGWIVLGVAAVVGAMHALSQVNWSAIGDAISNFVKSAVDWLKHPFSHFTAADAKALGGGGIESMGVKPNTNPFGFSAEDARKLGGGDSPATVKPNPFGFTPEDARKLGGDGSEIFGKTPGKGSMFSPGISTQKEKPIALSLNVDGRTLAQAVSEQLALLSEHNTNAPDFNGAAMAN